MQSAGGLLGLMEILLARVPEDDAARDLPDGDRDVQFADRHRRVLTKDLRCPRDRTGRNGRKKQDKRKAPGATARGTSELDSLVARALHNSADIV